MKRAAILCVALAIGMVFIDLAPVWGRGFGESRGGGGGGGGGFRGGGGFSHVPSPSFGGGGGYRAPSGERQSDRAIRSCLRIDAMIRG